MRYLRSLVGDDAEDVASETWLQITRGIGDFRGDGDAFRGWAATIGRNRAMDHLRYHRRRPAAPMPAEDLADQTDRNETSSDALDAVASQRALALIGSLPPDQAEAVMLRVVMGLDATSAARVLGKRPGAVRTACHRGLRRLAALLDPAAASAAADKNASTAAASADAAANKAVGPAKRGRHAGPDAGPATDANHMQV
jgi:RNA polymerase sigma-70 factor, ECF subfamily